MKNLKKYNNYYQGAQLNFLFEIKKFFLRGGSQLERRHKKIEYGNVKELQKNIQVQGATFDKKATKINFLFEI